MDCRYEFEIVIKILLCSPVIGLSSLVGQNYHRTGFIRITKKSTMLLCDSFVLAGRPKLSQNRFQFHNTIIS